jgi:hypothetical protein
MTKREFSDGLGCICHSTMQNYSVKFKVFNFALVIAVILSFLLLVFETAYGQSRGTGAQPFLDPQGKATDKPPTFESAKGYIKVVTEKGYGEQATQTTLTGVVGAVIKGALTLVGAIFLIMMVYGGYNWMIDRGDAERVKIAKDTITRAIVGMVIVLGAYAITAFVTDRLIKAAIKAEQTTANNQ